MELGLSSINGDGKRLYPNTLTMTHGGAETAVLQNTLVPANVNSVF